MLSNIVSLLVNRIESTKLISKVNGISDLITEVNSSDDKVMKFPAIYKGQGELFNISETDFRAGVSFFLKGRNTHSEDEGKRGCKVYMKSVFRPILYLIVDRPSADSEHNLEIALTQALSIKNDSREDVGVNIIRGGVTSFETEKETVVRDVFENVEIRKYPDLTFMKAELEITAYYYVDCLPNICE